MWRLRVWNVWGSCWITEGFMQLYAELSLCLSSQLFFFFYETSEYIQISVQYTQIKIRGGFWWMLKRRAQINISQFGTEKKYVVGKHRNVVYFSCPRAIFLEFNFWRQTVQSLTWPHNKVSDYNLIRVQVKVQIPDLSIHLSIQHITILRITFYFFLLLQRWRQSLLSFVHLLV